MKLRCRPFGSHKFYLKIFSSFQNNQLKTYCFPPSLLTLPSPRQLTLSVAIFSLSVFYCQFQFTKVINIGLLILLLKILRFIGVVVKRWISRSSLKTRRRKTIHKIMKSQCREKITAIKFTNHKLNCTHWRPFCLKWTGEKTQFSAPKIVKTNKKKTHTHKNTN